MDHPALPDVRWLHCELRAKPTSKRARHKCATVTVTFGLDQEECPSREQAALICAAPEMLEGYRRAAALVAGVSDAWRDTLEERQRQVETEGYTPSHDDEHDGGELAMAAACYATPPAYRPEDDSPPEDGPEWPWGAECWRPGDRRRELVKAAALIIAEIERIDRLAARGPR